MKTLVSTSLKTAMAVKHSVENYDKWLDIYLKKSEKQNRIGVYRSLSNPNDLLVFEATESHKNAKEYLNSDSLKEAMKEAGVNSEVQNEYIDIKTFNPNNVDSKYAITVRHSVKDFNNWKAYFEADNERREESGIYLVAMGTIENNPKEVYMCFTTRDEESAKDFANDPILEEIMKEAGVTSEPKFEYWNAGA